MDSKYIQMQVIERKPKTVVFEVQSKSDHTPLGKIKWYPSWRQYCFFPASLCIFSKGCMVDINSFIEQLMDDRKEILKGVKIEYF